MEWESFRRGVDVYVVARLDDARALHLVADKLGLGLDAGTLSLILRRETPEEIRTRREEVRLQETDAARLLKAVGEAGLRSSLPGSLLAILEEREGRLTGLQVAQAAIATWHTDALRQHRDRLGPLNPPKKWAGSARAVKFVRALGFPEEWAGERNRRRDPFMEVDGPYMLPPLHNYQRKIVDQTRHLFRDGLLEIDKRRGMISMPTGSGKTRVAVQAVVEALCKGELTGGVLWVADRDELCEQAVEAWCQVWAVKGARRERLRISRFWQGQPDPHCRPASVMWWWRPCKPLPPGSAGDPTTSLSSPTLHWWFSTRRIARLRRYTPQLCRSSGWPDVAAGPAIRF